MDQGSSMHWLNYHHLYYFWVVAREGSISKATQELRLAQPTISGQLRELERQLGERLFKRQGRSLALTDVGRVVYQYASEIFALGRDLQQALRGHSQERLQLHVGVTDAVPKLIAHELLRPALTLDKPLRIHCREGSQERLVAALAIHELDVVLSDTPLAAGVKVRAYNHLLGECGVSIYGAPALCHKYKPRFPGSLSGAPLLLPSEHAALRRSLEHWFRTQGVEPQIVGEFDDSALMKVFAQSGAGMFAGPSIMAEQIRDQHGCQQIGEASPLSERFYAISVERRIKHPAVLAICQAARDQIFLRPSS